MAALRRAFCIWAGMVVLGSFAQAAPVGLTGQYQFLSGTHQFYFLVSEAPAGAVQISSISFTLGPGLQFDFEAGAPGFDPFQNFTPFFFSTGGSTMTVPASGTRGPAVFQFTDFGPGEQMNLVADIDTLTQDGVTPADFAAGGRLEFTITFAATAGYLIQGANQITVLGTDPFWSDTPSSNVIVWGAAVDLVSDVPEPGSLGLAVAGFFALGLAASRRT